MSIAVIAPGRDLSGLIAEIRKLEPTLEIDVWPDLKRPDQVDFAVCWNPPPGAVAGLPSLKAATSFGAGVDGLIADPSLPPDLPLGRLSGPHLARDMAGWVMAQVTSHWFELKRFARQQSEQRWQPWSPQRSPRIGLLGTGAVTAPLIKSLDALGFEILGWNRRGTPVDGVSIHSGASGLTEVARRADYLICLLPLTPATVGILDQNLFAAMPAGSVLINAGRGRHLVEDDLLRALDQGRPGHAVLDVFEEEPLPQDHPFWRHGAISISPHCAALSRDAEVASLLVESYRRVRAGRPPLGEVDRALGY
jgi:glyoxylate/hydroxypyruvate reductase A